MYEKYTLPQLFNVSVKKSKKLKALIIDDETDTCYLLSSILKQKDIQAEFAGSLAEAEKMMQSTGDFYLIFLDNHLPDGLGVSYIDTIKRKYPLSRLVMITAHDTTADRKKAETGGVDRFIGKPFSKDMIFRTIEELHS